MYPIARPFRHTSHLLSLTGQKAKQFRRYAGYLLIVLPVLMLTSGCGGSDSSSDSSDGDIERAGHDEIVYDEANRTFSFPNAENEIIESTLDEVQRDHILKVLASCDGQIAGRGGAAQILGIHPNTLRSRLKKLGISPPE